MITSLSGDDFGSPPPPPVADGLGVLVMIFWFATVVLVPVAIFSFATHFFLSMPMRRRDRARFFLDLLEAAIDRGQPVERAILSAAENRDRVMGVRFYQVAAHIESGAPLGVALEKVPVFLPPQVNAMLGAGQQFGELKKVLPACREVLRVPPNTVLATTHYMVSMLLLLAPITCWLISLLGIYVLPKFQDIAAGLDLPVWSLAQFVFQIAPQIVMLEASISLVLVVVTLVYIGGPGFVRWFQFRRVPIADWIAWKMPWKQKKLLRAFSAMLAVLIDSGMPEAMAVHLAGESTANEICRRRARRVLVELAGGTKLDDAIRKFDGTGEFHWRLANAVQTRGGFLNALRGWHAALDARAFQQEEAAAHIFTSGLVILNGLVVGLIAIGMFGLLVMILKGTLGAT